MLGWLGGWGASPQLQRPLESALETIRGKDEKVMALEAAARPMRICHTAEQEATH